MPKSLLLLHGALGSKAQLEPLKELMQNDYQIYTFNFAGHGGKELPEIFSIELFAQQAMEFCKANMLEKISVFGYSMGGYVALFLAKNYPSLIESVITLGTKLDWNEATATGEVAMMNPQVMEQKVPAFTQQLQTRHSPQNWKAVMNKTADMLTAMGAAPPLKPTDFEQIKCNVLLMLGDRDKMVTAGETMAMYKKLHDAQLCILPGTPHAIEQADINLVKQIVHKFLRGKR